MERADLDHRITRIGMTPLADELALPRLKKRKLWLHDRIACLEFELHPKEPA